MSTIAAQVQVAAPQDLAGLARAVVAWLEKNLFQAVLFAVIGAVVGCVGNVVLMGLVYDGFEKVAGGPATGKGNMLTGSLIWGIGSTVGFGLIGYWRSVGTARFFRDLSQLPVTIGALWSQDGQAARIHLLWGAALSLFVTLVISPWLSGVVAVALAAAAPSLLGAILSGLLYRAWYWLVGLVAPTRRQPAHGPIGMTVAILGGSVGLALGFFITGASVKFGLALVCAIAAWVMALTGKGPSTPLCVLWLSLTVLFCFPAAVLAHDAGVWESGGVMPWLRAGGFLGLIPWALPGAGASAIGAGLGTALGSLLGQFGAAGGLGGGNQPLPGDVVNPPNGAPGGAPYDQGAYDRLSQLLSDVTDPALHARLAALGAEAGRSGTINLGELDAIAQAQQEIDARRRGEIDAHNEESRGRWLDRLREREAAAAARAAAEREAQRALDDIKSTADRHGWDDVWERAITSGRTLPDGTIDPAYVNQLRNILRGRVGQEASAPFTEGGYRSPFDDFVSSTVDDIRHSVIIRIGVGVLTGGSSEVFYQGQAAWEAMQRSFDAAAEHGRSWGITDALRSGYGSLARENLPVNTIETLMDPQRRTATGIMGSVVGDAFSIFGARETIRNLRGSLQAAQAGRGLGEILTSRGYVPPHASPPQREGRRSLAANDDTPDYGTTGNVISISIPNPWNHTRRPGAPPIPSPPLPPEMQNPGPPIEPKGCVPVAVTAAGAGNNHVDIERAMGPYRTPAKPGDPWPVGGVHPTKFPAALRAAEQNPRPLNEFINPHAMSHPIWRASSAGTTLGDVHRARQVHVDDLADRMGQYLRENPNTKVIAPVRSPNANTGAIPTKPNHVVTIFGTEMGPNGEVLVHAFDPQIGRTVTLPARSMGIDFNGAQIVRPPLPPGWKPSPRLPPAPTIPSAPTIPPAPTIP